MDEEIKWTIEYWKGVNERLRKVGMPQVIIDEENKMVYYYRPDFPAPKLIVTEENESSKFAEMINNMVDYKFHCIHSGKGFNSSDFTYVCTKTRGELEPLIGKPLVPVEPIHENIIHEKTVVDEPAPEVQNEMPQLINECIDALTLRGMNITTETVRICLEGRFKNEDEYDKCIEWLDNIGFGGDI